MASVPMSRRITDLSASAADPACQKSASHADFAALALAESQLPPPPFVYRRMGAAGA